MKLAASAAVPIGAILTLVLSAIWVWRSGGSPASLLFTALVVLFLGYWNAGIAVQIPPRSALVRECGAQVRLLGRVASLPKTQHGHFRFLLDVSAVSDEPVPRPTLGRCQVYVKCSTDTEQPAFGYGDRVVVFCSLEEVPPPANRGQFDYRAFLLRQGTVLAAYAASPRSVEVQSANPAALWRLIAAARVQVTNELGQNLPDDLAQLAVSVVYGDKITDLPEEISESFRRAGLTHILVASGTQVSLLIVLLGLLSFRLQDNALWSGRLVNLGLFLLTLIVVLLYAAITGFETSILRAVGMGVLLLIGRLISRDIDGLSALALSGLAILASNPLELLAPGFQLSFAATFGLIYLAGVGFPLVAALQTWLRRALQALITTVGAQLFVTPVLISEFHQVSLTGLVSNIVAIPLAFLLLISGGLHSLGLSRIPLLGQVSHWIVYGLTAALKSWAAFFASLSLSQLHVPQAPVWCILAFVALLLLGGEWVKARERLAPRTIQLLFAATAGLSLLLLSALLHWWLVPRPELAVLALGQGRGPARSAYLWRSGAGVNTLLLSGKGLERRHNSDTVTAALAWRGVNRLHQLGWIDAQEPKVSVWPGAGVQRLEPGSASREDSALQWLIADDDVFGAECELGRKRLWIVWDRAYYLLRKADPNTAPQHCDLLVMDGAHWQQLSTGQREALQRKAAKVLIQHGVREAASGIAVPVQSDAKAVLEADSEVSIRLKNGELQLTALHGFLGPGQRSES